MRILLLRPSRRRALALPVVLALLLVPTQAVGAAGDPVSQAEARVTAARQAANAATARYEDAQTTYYTLQDDIDRTKQQVAGLQKNADALSAVATARALEAYKGGNADLDAIMNGADVLEAMRRSELLDRVNRQGNAAVDQLGAMTEDLHLQEAELDHKLGQQADLVANLKATQADVRRALAAAEAAEQQLKERLAREQRERELQDRLQKARAAAAASASKKGSGGPLPRGKSVVVVGRVPVPGSGLVVQRLVRRPAFGRSAPPGRRHDGGAGHVDLRRGERFGLAQLERPRAATRSGCTAATATPTSTRTCRRTSVAAGRSARATRSARSATPGTRRARRTSTSRSIRAVVPQWTRTRPSGRTVSER